MLPPSPVIDRCKTGVLAPLAFLAGTKLDIFTELAGSPKSAEALATNMSVEPDWLQPLLFHGDWIVTMIPPWVAALTHLVFAWTMALVYPLGTYTPYEPTTE